MMTATVHRMVRDRVEAADDSMMLKGFPRFQPRRGEGPAWPFRCLGDDR
jgi:hypothetical protein